MTGDIGLILENYVYMKKIFQTLEGEMPERSLRYFGVSTERQTVSSSEHRPAGAFLYELQP
jgi:hypothetical protein